MLPNESEVEALRTAHRVVQTGLILSYGFFHLPIVMCRMVHQ